jgi:hypothetical protein
MLPLLHVVVHFSRLSNSLRATKSKLIAELNRHRSRLINLNLSLLSHIQHLSRKAASCDICFKEGWVDRSFVDVAQPRWVGSRYWESSFRVVILMLNPGQGKKKKPPVESKKLLQSFRDGGDSLDAVLKYQREGMKSWGKPPGRFLNFYCDGLGFDLEEIAFVNVAWCATEGNRYPKKMLDCCFSRHTAGLLEILEPSVVLASGVKTRGYAAGLHGTRVIRLIHHAHRKGNDVQTKELDRVKKELKALKSVN